MSARPTDAGNYLGKLVMLKDLDSVIDFARASNQLAIVLHLYNQGKPLSTDELARDLVDSKKSILDSIRKLEKKNLVVKREIAGRLYVELSEEGKKFVAKLLELIKPLHTPVESKLETPVRLNIVKEIVVSYSLLRLLVKVGLAPPYAISLDKLHRIVGDERISEVLLESFTKSPTRLFKVVEMRGTRLLALDKAGVELLRKTPYYQVYSSSSLYRFLVKLFRTPLVSELSTRLNASLSSVTVALITVALVTRFYPLALVAVFTAALQVGLNVFLEKLSSLYA